MAVTVLAIAGATVVGYLVSCWVPSAHFPRTFGVLAADSVMAGLALLGLKPAGDVLAPFVIVSACVAGAIYAYRDTFGDDKSN